MQDVLASVTVDGVTYEISGADNIRTGVRLFCILILAAIKGYQKNRDSLSRIFSPTIISVLDTVAALEPLFRAIQRAGKVQ